MPEVGVGGEERAHCWPADDLVVIDETSWSVVLPTLAERRGEKLAVDEQAITFCPVCQYRLNVYAEERLLAPENKIGLVLCHIGLSADDADALVEGLKKLRKYRKNDDICPHRPCFPCTTQET